MERVIYRHAADVALAALFHVAGLNVGRMHLAPDADTDAIVLLYNAALSVRMAACRGENYLVRDERRMM